MNLNAWATTWGVPMEAVTDLYNQLGLHRPVDNSEQCDSSESSNSKAVRLKSAQEGGILWRNNVGAVTDGDRHIRFGLANESKQMNARVKSSDLVGIRPVVITEDMVGQTIGQFTAREVKRGGWRYTGTEREKAQRRWLEIVLSYGGDAAFTTGETWRTEDG